MTSMLAINSLGIIVFLFIFWKKLREDYAVDSIFSTSFYILIGGGLGLAISSALVPGWWFWTLFSGLFLGLLLGIVRYRLRAYESFESFVVAILPWLAIYSLYDSVTNLSLNSLIHAILVIALIYIYTLLSKKYKSISWYKSGRIGFSGLAIAGIYFLTRSTVALFLSDMISFSLKFESIISAAVSFISFLLLYNLGRTKN